jgi:hypothetical protein
MVARLRLTLLAAALATLAAFAGACKREPPPPPAPPAPVDQLAPGEVVEGKDKAFALPLPRHTKVTGRFDTSVTVRSPLKPEDLANFVRARVKDGNVVAGGAATTFEDVVVPAEPQRRLTIEVRKTPLTGDARSEMTVRDTTPPPVEPGLTDEQRWQKAGLDPNGNVLDPKNTE